VEKQTFFEKLIKRRIVSMILLFILLFVLFAILSNGLILNPMNIVNILNSMALTTFLTTGVAMLMISGDLDLSTGANGTLCGMFLAYALQHGMALVPALIITLVIGSLIGLLNGALTNGLKMPSFIATLATSSVATGLVYWIANKKMIDVTNPFLKSYGKDMLFTYIPLSALVAFVLMVIAGIALHKSSYGRKIYLVGGNKQAAMLSGINPKKISYSLFILCGFFSSVAGITFVSRMQSANMQGIIAARFQGITAAVLGGISFGGGSGGMAGAFVGLLVLNTFSNGMTVMGVSPYWQNAATGVLLILALTLDFFQSKQSMKVVA